MANSIIKNKNGSVIVTPIISHTGVTLTNYQSYIQNGRLHFSGNIKNNSGEALTRYDPILDMQVNTETYAGNALDVTDVNNPKPMVCLMQAGTVRLGNDLTNGHTAWVNVSARLIN